MSTAQNIIDKIQPRIGTYQSSDLYGFFNDSIRTIAKHLFVRESTLVKEPFELTFEIEEDYQDISSSYSDFWRLIGRPRVVGEDDTLKPAPMLENEYDKYIIPYKPDIHDTNQGSLSYSLNTFVDDGQDFSDWAEGDYKIVITNSDGTITRGYIGDTVSTTQVNIYQDNGFSTSGWLGTSPSGKTPSSYQVQSQYTGTPEYFELIGKKLYLYPIWGYSDDDPAEIHIITGYYFPKPTEITDTADTIPFDELFDDIIEEYIVKIVRSGYTGADDKSDPLLLRQFLRDAVDDIINIGSPRGPKFINTIKW